MHQMYREHTAGRVDAIVADLNPSQREAVESRSGPLMILAGAGSGKTRVLTRRLAHLVAMGDARLEEILAVTFTNKAAREMRERIHDLLGHEVAPGEGGRLWMGTFHSMGARILRRHAELLGYTQSFTILDTGDQKEMIKQLLEQLEFRHGYWTPDRLVNSFSRWKDDGVGPEQLDGEHVHRERDRRVIADIYQQYQDLLRANNAMDFGDLLLNGLHLWRAHPELLELYASRFRYVLVDEYQDTNAVQYQWIKALASHHRNLCVVGDDDQLIYSWRGARLDNILLFGQEFPDVTVVRLEQNYRSTGNILHAASSLIANNRGRMEKTLWTSGAAGSRVDVYQAEDDRTEAAFVAGEIRRRCPDQQFDRCAVLVRTSRQTRAIEDALLRAAIPYRIVGGLRFMDRAEIKDLVAYLRLVVSPQDNMAFERAIQVPRRGLGETSLQLIRDHASQQGVSLLQASDMLVRDNGGGIRSGAARVALEQFVHLMAQTHQMFLDQMAPVEILGHILLTTGYLRVWDGDARSQERADNIGELQGELARRGDLTQFLEDAALVSDMVSERREALQEHGVTISTLHAAKGLEFPVVFLVGMEEELLPHKFALEEGGADALEEERRLAYVGMTRAREHLYLTHARQRLAGNRPVLSKPSRFLAELPTEILNDCRNALLSVRRGISPSLLRRWQ
jgi:DNA helicase-2/ATP-dependent DNA helicase PcrA